MNNSILLIQANDTNIQLGKQSSSVKYVRLYVCHNIGLQIPYVKQVSEIQVAIDQNR